MTESRPQTWYSAQVMLNPERPALTEGRSCDVCVVGGGLAGLTAARELSRAGVSVILLEEHRVGWGASGRNAGFVSSGFAESFEAIVRRCGVETARRLHDYSQLGAAYVDDTIRQLAPEIKMGDGICEVWRHRTAEVNATAVAATNRDCSEDYRLLASDALRQRLNTDRYFVGVEDPRGFHINPLAYVLAMAEDLERLGGTIHEGSKALNILQQQSGITISTQRAQLECQQLVLCTSGFDRNLFPELGRAVLPIATHIVVSEKNDKVRRLIATDAAISDSRRAGDYYRIVDNNRLLWGGKITTRTAPPANFDDLMRKAICEVFPSLNDLAIDFRWSGLMGYCVHKMPIVGELAPRIWAATAFGGHGLNTTAMAGVLIADAIANGDERWRDFAGYRPIPLQPVLGKVGVQLSYWAMQARDRWDEALCR